MNAEDVIKDIEEAIGKVRDSNQDVVSVKALLGYLKTVHSELKNTDNFNERQHKSDLSSFQAQNERYVAEYNANHLTRLEMFRSVMLFAQMAIKNAMLLNGGATVALLAFIGNIWSKDIAKLSIEL